jgi:hypothetical protein
MKEGKYYRANINHIHDLVKGKVLVLLRYKGTWHTTTELADLCKFKSTGTMRSHCGLWAKKHVDKHNHVHDGILLRRARGLVGQHRPVWEYSISERGKRWVHWNIDEGGLLTTVMEELGLIPQTNPTDNKLIPDPESNTISELPDDEIKRICQEVLNKHRTQNSNKDGFLDGNSKNSV